MKDTNLKLEFKGELDKTLVFCKLYEGFLKQEGFHYNEKYSLYILSSVCHYFLDLVKAENYEDIKTICKLARHLWDESDHFFAFPQVICEFLFEENIHEKRDELDAVKNNDSKYLKNKVDMFLFWLGDKLETC